MLRPATPHTPSVHAFLRALAHNGFEGAPLPIGVDVDGGERLTFIDGEVALSPYPAWSQTDAALASIARLLRAMHDAARSFDHRGHRWAGDLADVHDAEVMCHNDVELSNVVFRGGVAVALIDFEFAAPGRRVHDLAQFARLCVPVEHEVDQARMGWTSCDGPARLRLIADAYGLDAGRRAELLPALDEAIDRMETLAHRSLDRGGAQALEAMAAIGGIGKYDRRRQWWGLHRDAFAKALR